LLHVILRAVCSCQWMVGTRCYGCQRLLVSCCSDERACCPSSCWWLSLDGSLLRCCTTIGALGLTAVASTAAPALVAAVVIECCVSRCCCCCCCCCSREVLLLPLMHCGDSACCCLVSAAMATVLVAVVWIDDRRNDLPYSSPNALIELLLRVLRIVSSSDGCRHRCCRRVATVALVLLWPSCFVVRWVSTVLLSSCCDGRSCFVVAVLMVVNSKDR
jgi:hypothetical protein